MAQTLENLACGSQGLIYCAESVPWLLMICWLKETCRHLGHHGIDQVLQEYSEESRRIKLEHSHWNKFISKSLLPIAWCLLSIFSIPWEPFPHDGLFLQRNLKILKMSHICGYNFDSPTGHPVRGQIVGTNLAGAQYCSFNGEDTLVAVCVDRQVLVLDAKVNWCLLMP